MVFSSRNPAGSEIYFSVKALSVTRVVILTDGFLLLFWFIMSSLGAGLNFPLTFFTLLSLITLSSTDALVTYIFLFLYSRSTLPLQSDITSLYAGLTISPFVAS